MAEATTPEGGGRKPFAAFIQEQRKGILHGELSDSLAELLLAVSELRKPGTLQLTIKVAPNQDGATVTISDKVKLTVPEADRGGAIFFVDEAGFPSRNNPAQPELPLREAPAAAASA